MKTCKALYKKNNIWRYDCFKELLQSINTVKTRIIQTLILHLGKYYWIRKPIDYVYPPKYSITQKAIEIL